MRVKPSIAYLVLLASSLAILGLHYILADHAIEHSRTGTGFLPAHILFWRWFGELSWALPVLAIVFFVLSLRGEWFSRASTLFGFAAVQLGFVTFYAIYCAF